jgi:hypothetical protein
MYIAVENEGRKKKDHNTINFSIIFAQDIRQYEPKFQTKLFPFICSTEIKNNRRRFFIQQWIRF